jgi:lipoprotein-anchoring transpeptidase ErfK/SrfK
MQSYGRRREWLVVALATVALMTTSACTPAQQAAGQQAGPVATPTPTVAPVALSLAIRPDAGAKNLPVSSEVGITLTGGTVSDVSVTKSGGGKISGAMRDDGTSWVPAAPLNPATTYQVSVTAQGEGGQTDTKTTNFTTMGNPGRLTGTGLYLFNGETVGVGMPVVVEFSPAVPESARAAVQQRLFVTSDPPQVGAWHWASGSQVWFRPAKYWKSGTKLSVRAGLRGVPMGNGYYGDTDRSATATVGQKVVIEVDNATKQMKVFVDDQLARTMPVSLGKPSTPSSSGHMVTMTHDYQTTFDTTDEGPGGYRVDVNYAMRLTWGGEFIHAAPWSEGDQGHRNVSHGCVNLGMSNSSWLFNITHIGDPVSVTGTERTLVAGNGWTAWNQSWEEYIKGSAIPVPAEVAAAGAASDPQLAGAAPQGN